MPALPEGERVIQATLDGPKRFIWHGPRGPEYVDLVQRIRVGGRIKAEIRRARGNLVWVDNESLEEVST